MGYEFAKASVFVDMNGVNEDGGWAVVERKARRRAGKGLGKGGSGGGNALRRLPAEVLAKSNAQD